MLEHDGAEALVRQGQEAGFLTTEEISLALDELGLEPGQVDEFYDALEELQIEVVDEADAERRARGRPRLRGQGGLDRFAAALPEGHRQGAAPDGRAGGRAREAHRARRPPRQAADGGGEPPARRLDREELPQPGAAVPRSDPGGDDRPRPGRREVRLPAWLQVLDLRDLVDPPGGCARARRQGPDDPHARARGREAEQDRAHRAQAARRVRPRPDRRRDRDASSSSTVEEVEQIRRCAQAPVSLEKPVGDEEESEFGHFIADQTVPRPGRGRRV